MGTRFSHTAYTNTDSWNNGARVARVSKVI